MSKTDRPNSGARVTVIGTGGTIASCGADSLDLTGYIERKKHLTIHGLMDQFPEVHRVAQVTAVPYENFASQAIGPRQWQELAARVQELAAARPSPHGIVITHGTATLEETAYFLNLVLKVTCPVVLVGSQRPATALGTDAGMNLFNAVRVAAAPGSRGRGVLVLLNDEIHAAREVTKSSTLKLHTFRSPDFGALGHTDADRVSYYRRLERRSAPDTAFDVAGRESLPRVDIVTSYAGADGALVRASVAAGAKGIVSAGFAPGLGTADELAALNSAAADGVVIAQSSRVGSGRVASFGVAQPTPCVTADNLTPQKARVLLMLALAHTPDIATIQELFETH